MKSSDSIRRILLALALTSLAQPAAHADDGTWINPSTGGLWGTGTNWSDGTVADGYGSTANFSTLDLTADNTVHLDGSRTIAGLRFGDATTGTAGSWILDDNASSGANILTFDGTTPTITVNGLGSNKTTSISAVIGGTVGLTKTGPGQLTLNGSVVHALTGGVALNSGLTLLDFSNLATPTDLLASSNTLALGGGNLSIFGKSSINTSQTLGAVTVTGGGQILVNPNGASRTATLNLGTITATTAGSSLLVGKSASASGTATVTTTSGADPQGIYGGRVVFTSDGGTTANWATTASGGPIYTLSAYSAYVTMVAGATSDMDNVTTGALTLTGAHTHNSLKTTGALDLGANLLTLTSGGLIVGGTVSGTAGGTRLTAGNGSGAYDLMVYSAGNQVLSAVIGDNGGNAVSFTKAGPGQLEIRGANTYTGNTAINAGTVYVNEGWYPGAKLGTNANKTVTIQSGATLLGERYNMAGSLLTLNGGTWNDNNGFGGSWTGPVYLGANSSIGSAGYGVSITGNISGPGGIAHASNNLTLNGTNSYTGPTVINGGTVIFPSPAALYNAVDTDWTPANITVDSGATLRLALGTSGVTNFTAAQVGTILTNLNSSNGNGLKAGATVGLDHASGTVTIANDITDSTGTTGGTLNLKKTSAGVLELTGNNTYTGQTFVESGTLKVSSLNYITTGTLSPNTSSSLGKPTSVANGTIVFGNGGGASGGILIYTGTGETTDRVISFVGQNNSAEVLDQSGTGLLKFLSAFPMQSQAKTLTLQGSNTGTGELSAILPDPSLTSKLTLNKSGSGTWTLSNANTYTGVTNVNGGALVLTHATALTGGIGATGGLSALTFNGGVVGLGAGGPGAGNFTRNLAAANTVTGCTFTGNGGWAAYGADRAVNLNNDSHQIVWATLSTGLNAKTLILGNVTATHTVDFQNPLELGTAARTVQADNGAAVIDGKLSGNLTGGSGGNLSKTGLGTLALSGTNSYAGTTSVSAGTLLVNGTHSGTGLVTVVSTATLGGTGSLGGAATFNSGAKAVFTVTRDPVTQANTTPLAIAGVMTYNATEVHLNLPANLPSGTYILATSSATPAGTVSPVPVVDSGSYAAGFTDATVSLDTGNNTLILTVTGLPLEPSTLAITAVNGGVNPAVGLGFSVVVQAQDANGTARFVLADTAVTLSLASGSGSLGGTVSGTILAGTSSVTLGPVTYNTAESGVVLTATRTSGDTLTAANSAPFTVIPDTTPTYLTMTGYPSPQTAGVTGGVTVTAKTVSGATATTYTGTVHFTSTALAGGLPSDYTFVSGDNGVHVFTGVTLNTAGTQSITATDTVTSSITGTQSDISVVPAAASGLIVSGFPSPHATGVPASVTVTAKDAYDNTVTEYNGTIQFTSSDGNAILPGEYTFVSGDAGVHTFSNEVTLITLGVQSITATDSGNAIAGTQSDITVWIEPTIFSWTSGVSGTWSDTANWTNDMSVVYAPVATGQADYTLNFNAGSYTATNNLNDGFLLNKLTFSGAATLAGTSGLALTANGETLPTILQNSGNGVLVVPPLNLAADVTIAGSGNGQVTLFGAISGPGSLTKSNSGTLILNNAANSYGGGTRITTGTLSSTVAGNGGLGGTGLVTLESGATLSFDGPGPNVPNSGAFNGGTVIATNGFGAGWSGPVTLTGTTTIQTNYNMGFGNVISGTGGLIKTGGNTLTLSGQNTYSGNTAVNVGTLALADNARLAFVLTDESSNQITGTATASLQGDFTIDTSAVTTTTGTWTLVDVTTLIESFTSSFTVVDFTDPETDNVWTKVDGARTWDFDESTGILTLSVTTSGSAYDTWATEKLLTEGNNGAGDDPDKDGRNNLAEFAFNGDPLSGADNGRIYVLSEDSDFDDPDTDKELILTVAVRAGTPAFTGSPSPAASKDGISYTIEGSLTLGGFATAVNVVPTPVTIDGVTPLPAAGTGYEYRSFSLSGSNGLPGAGFLRAKVTQP